MPLSKQELSGMAFNPFDKNLHDLAKEDLIRLIQNNVAEGYFVEYKTNIPDSKKIGKSIASFANTYGGWYIVGVKTDSHNVASEICGFSLNECRDPISVVRDSIKEYVDPTPVFFIKVIEIETDKVVLVAQVPGNQETPFIHRDGRVYRRKHDSSDPDPESNRHSFDRLIDRGRDIQNQFKNFCIDDIGLANNSYELSYVNLYLSPYPLGLINKFETFSVKEFSEVLRLSQQKLLNIFGNSGQVECNIPFNYCQPTYNSVILRQADPTTSNVSVSMQIFRDGRARLFIPIKNIININEYNFQSQKTCEVIESYWYSDEKDNKIYNVKFLDASLLCLVIVIALGFYKQFVSEDGYAMDIQVAVDIKNVSNSVLFFDSDEWGEHVKNFGFPVVNFDSVRLPEGLKNSMVFKFDKDLPMGVCAIIALTFGFPLELITHTLSEAIVRAKV